jgi:RNA polymerase sigma factor (sigma-70 family)
VWAELLMRLPTFHLDPQRGQFDTWLFHIVRGKTANVRRSKKLRPIQEESHTLQTALDRRPTPPQTLERKEIQTLALHKLKMISSERTFQVLWMRLLEEKTVPEVAKHLDITQEQVWYAYHRARRALAKIGSQLASAPPTTFAPKAASHNFQGIHKIPAQGINHFSVSQSIRPPSLIPDGDHGVDTVFQKLELGRRDLHPEWKIEWTGDAEPRPVLYVRKMAIVAYAEICGHADFVNANWPLIANATIAAGVAAEISTILATPAAALPVFQSEFSKRLHANATNGTRSPLQVALSAKPKASGPWHQCKG